MRIKAAVARAFGAPLSIEAVEIDEPRDGEILVRLVAAGVAGVDRDALAGRLDVALPFVPGSEAAGIVERVGPGVEEPAPGDAVLVATASCGVCQRCRAGDPRHCQAFAACNFAGCRADGSLPFVGDGHGIHGFFFGQSAFATHVLCRAAAAVVVDADVPLELFAAVTGEFLSGAAPVLAASADGPILIAGAGIVGLAACMAAKTLPERMIIVAEPDETRRSLALDLGATIAAPMDDGLPAVVQSLSPKKAALALDTIGTTSSRRACLACLAGGPCAVPDRVSGTAGAPTGEDGPIVSADAHVVAADLVPRLVASYKAGRLPLEKLVRFFPFDRVNDALDALENGTAVKAVLRFPLGPFGDLDRAGLEGAVADTTSDSSEAAGSAEQETPAVPVTA